MSKIPIRLLLCFLCICSLDAQEAKQTGEVLSNKEQSIIEIASHTAQGNLTCLKDALNEGLANGLTVNETKEILVHPTPMLDSQGVFEGYRPFLRFWKKEKPRV